MVTENKKFLIVVLLEPVDVDALSDRDLQVYLRTGTYIDALNLPNDLHRYPSYQMASMFKTTNNRPE